MAKKPNSSSKTSKSSGSSKKPAPDLGQVVAGQAEPNSQISASEAGTEPKPDRSEPRVSGPSAAQSPNPSKLKSTKIGPSSPEPRLEVSPAGGADGPSPVIPVSASQPAGVVVTRPTVTVPSETSVVAEDQADAKITAANPVEAPADLTSTDAVTGHQPTVLPSDSAAAPGIKQNLPGTEAAPAEPRSVNVEEPLPEVQVLQQDVGPAPTTHPMPSLFIVQIAPEMAPVAKVGGLADVVFGLTRELAIRGNHVEIVLPKYSSMRYDYIHDLQPAFNDLWVPWYGGAIHCTVYFGLVFDRKCFFIEPHSADNFFSRGSIYGFPDDVMRYAFFSRAAIEFLWKSNKHPDIIHCHDWQTALVPVFLYEIYQRMGMQHPRVCLTIHNFQHQGVCGGELLRATGLNHPERFFDYNRMRDNQHPNALNLLKGGVVYSNFVTTVSPRYAFESKDQGQGFGLEPTLHTHHIKYGGVINGIDYDVWNPEVDHYIPVQFGVSSIDRKYDNKRALRHRLMLSDNEKPIVAFIGRLDPQKGLELVRHAIFYAMERGAQFVLLGSSPYQHINSDFWGLKQMLNDSPDCHLEIGFNEELSHLIYAGADMMLVPSRFEPCGLTQLVALRYGTIPVVRAVGGLADTVFDKDYSERPLHERNGYVFNNYDPPGLESALGRAISCYYNFPEHFRELIKNAMRYDYSWNYPGRDYLNIYDYIRDR